MLVGDFFIGIKGGMDVKKVFELKIEGDLHTPIGIYRSIREKKKILLESSLKHEQQGRYSFIGASPYMELYTSGGVTIEKDSDGNRKEHTGRFLDKVKQLMPKEAGLASAYPFIGGAVGYVGYDIIREYEDIGAIPADELNMPDAHLMFFRDVIVYDHMLQQISIVSIREEAEEAEFAARAEKLASSIRNNRQHEQEENMLRADTQFTSERKKEDFEQMVRAAKEEIAKGEIFQVVLSERFSADFSGDAFQFYRILRKRNPSPYMFYIDFEDYQVVGSSPESLLKGDGRQVRTNPIAGTRRRGLTPEEDAALEAELLKDVKELAEHKMLVDLGRNDLGRVCGIGTVELTKFMDIEKYKYVMHIVSEVEGTMREGLDNTDVLASCLPAGTVSGAPKIRAMSIINEYEKVKRNVYGGAVGYFSSHGAFDFALAIRTMVVKGGKATIQAGAGIVHDSDPEREYEEVLNKAKALMEVQYDLVNR